MIYKTQQIAFDVQVGDGLKQASTERLECAAGRVARTWGSVARVMRFRTLSRRLAVVVGVAGGAGLLAVAGLSKQQSSRNVRILSANYMHEL